MLEAKARERLVRTVASAKSEVRAVLRARIVLAAADGLANGAIARELDQREHGAQVAGAVRRPGPGRPAGRRTLGPAAGLRARGSGGDRGHRHERAAPSGVDLVAPGHRPAGGRHVLRAGLRLPGWPDPGRSGPEAAQGPWLADPAGHPDFWQRAAEVCALYLDPPEGAVVLSIDEKTAIAARSRRHPGRPARPGEPVRQEFEYRRHGTVSLVTALDVRTGEVLTEVIARNDAVTFTAFLDQLDRAIAPGREIHVVLDNGSSHTAKHTKAWLAAHPRWHVRWTPPHASWLNQVELFFSALTRRVVRHGDFSSRDDLIEKLDAYVIGHNETAKPYRWTYEGTPLKAA